MCSQKSLNPWNYKPWWCQPWSIVLTGVLIVSSSWLLLKNIWVTIVVSLPILVWWTYFLILWPRLISASGILEADGQSTQNDFSQLED
ncbi:MAG: hypothetical protein F6K10_07915 [Moorea sp. SIO2B7]|nr:hypothetical protein [Moorena sp. SIO2B7]